MRDVRRWGTLVLGLLCALNVHASDYPAQPLTVIVPFPAGGTSSMVANAIRSKLAEKLGQPVIIEHLAGGAGAVGATHLKNAAPDGYTIMVASLTAYIVAPLMNGNATYDSARDFDLLTVAVRLPNVLVVRRDFPVDTLGQFIAYLKRSGGTTRFGTSGAGSYDHLLTETFWRRTGTSGTLLHRKGSGPAAADIAGGVVDASLMNLSVALPHIAAGQVKALALTSGSRWHTLPDVPTLGEAAVPDMETYSWQGIAAPKGLSPQVKSRLHQALVATMNAPEVHRRLMSEGLEVVANTPAEFEQLVRAEMKRWHAVVDAR